MPLSEIVSEPDMNSAEEVLAYITQIRQLARYLDVSDGEMESGSLRVDVNISLRNDDGSLGTRVEIKNVNSLRSIERALGYEIARQNKVLDEGGCLVRETRLWDDVAGVTRSMRSKEGERDYRYYVEMDLAPISAGPEYVEEIRKSLPEMPWEKRERFIRDHSLSEEEAAQLTEQKETADYFEECVSAGAPAAKCANWMRMEVQRLLHEMDLPIEKFPVKASELGKLIVRVEKRELSNTRPKMSCRDGRKGAARRRSDQGVRSLLRKDHGPCLEEIIKRYSQANPRPWRRSGREPRWREGEILQGLVMRETRGRQTPPKWLLL